MESHHRDAECTEKPTTHLLCVLRVSVVVSETLCLDEYRAVLRRDFVSLAQRCFRELNPQTRALRWLAHRGHRPEIRGGARGQHEPLGTDPVRLLCAGSRGQTIARLAAHCRQRLVLADLPDAAVAAMLELDTTARRWRLPHFGRRCADRPQRGIAGGPTGRPVLRLRAKLQAGRSRKGSEGRYGGTVWRRLLEALFCSIEAFFCSISEGPQPYPLQRRAPAGLGQS